MVGGDDLPLGARAYGWQNAEMVEAIARRRHKPRPGEGDLAIVGQLQNRLEIPGSTLSHHIAHLVNNDLVAQNREGRVLRCTANYSKMNALLAFLSEECCEGSGGCD